MLEIVLALAIVTQDQIPLGGMPSENAPRHATLTAGDTLEVRGEKGDYLQVYDHRRERAGYIRATQARRYTLAPEEAPRLKAIVNFLQDQPGQEALGIGHAAAFLKAAPAKEIDAGVLTAIGKMADRLAWRASRLTDGRNEKAAQTVSAHLESMAQYGVTVYSVERQDRMTLCYEGDAWRRILTMSATAEQQASAALSLTRHECVPSTLSPTERLNYDLQRAEWLERVLAAGQRKGNLPEHLKYRLKIRAAGVWAGIAHQLSRQPERDPAAILKAGQTAEAHLAGIDKKALTDGDIAAWHEAAIRVGASRWAAVPNVAAAPVAERPGIQLRAGKTPGQSCVEVVEDNKSVFSQCTYGEVWPASLAVSPDGKFMTLAVQPLENWREMWVFHKEGAAWQLEAVPPASEHPELGYIEFAGWVPGNRQFLVARETVENGRRKTSFEIWSRAALKVEKHADKPGNLTPFYRWQDPLWKSGTVALR
ncbi:MAG: hypothetical protein LBU11_10170 [Zoogloeaceae bacterium]|nr:hypothetical protein [Zoogloeaceae bacterium]